MDGLPIGALTPVTVIIATAVLWWRVTRVERELQRLRDWKHDEVTSELTQLKLRVGLAEHDITLLQEAHQ